MKQNPDDVLKFYDLYIEYSEKVDDIVDKLQQEQERFGRKIMYLMKTMGIGIEVTPAEGTDETKPF
jgi:hypothetical protein